MAHTQRTAEGGAQSCEAAISPREARKKFCYVFFLAIRKRSRSISAHSGHVFAFIFHFSGWALVAPSRFALQVPDVRGLQVPGPP